MIIGIPKEVSGENRVAVVPVHVPNLVKAGFEVNIETGAGEKAGFSDADYKEKGALVLSNRAEIFSSSDVILQVRGEKDASSVKKGQMLIGFFDPLGNSELAKIFSSACVKVFALELVPRITRAQAMDALSSQASIAGYKAVILAAEHLPKIFPMMMTAAGTLLPAKVFVIGAGVSGLQAIATAKKLGAVVSAYDVRPAVKEQIESLGAKFISFDIEAKQAEGTGGYAKEFTPEFYRKQAELMSKIVSESDVVIATALIPGKKAPVLITKEMVSKMAKESVIVDLAAERGGNCELTKPDEIIEVGGIKILGPTNLPSTVANHASQMYSKNIISFLLNLQKGEDEITKAALWTS